MPHSLWKIHCKMPFPTIICGEYPWNINKHCFCSLGKNILTKYPKRIQKFGYPTTFLKCPWKSPECVPHLLNRGNIFGEEKYPWISMCFASTVAGKYSFTFFNIFVIRTSYLCASLEFLYVAFTTINNIF